MHLHRAPFVRTAALVIGFATAYACGSPSTEDDCPQGSEACACAFGLCDDGLTCIADVCTPTDASSDSTADATTIAPTTLDDSSSSSSVDAESSSSDTGLDDTSSTGEPPSTDPIYDATVDGIPTSFDNDPHAYISPAGTLIVRGTDSSGTEMLLRIPPTGPGTYPCVLDELNVAIYYTQDGPIGPIEMSTRTSGICSITVETYGDVGEFVSGTFEGEVRFPGAMEIPSVVITDGIFNVVRTTDER